MAVGGLNSMSQHLSPKLSFNNEIEHGIAKAYEYFSTQLNDQNERPRLFGKQIFYESYEMVENKIVGFWHLISTKLINLSLLPCKGDIVYKQCDRNCIKLTRLIEIKNNKETRAVCLFRASHLPWIKDVIKLANERCEFVLCWQITDANNRKKLYVK